MEEPVFSIRGLEMVSVCAPCDGPFFQHNMKSKSTFWRDLQQCPHSNSSGVYVQQVFYWVLFLRPGAQSRVCLGTACWGKSQAVCTFHALGPLTLLSLGVPQTYHK